MGKKKSKEPEATPGDDAPSSQSDIFKTLFGDVSEQNAGGSSLFSDSNPFKRKPQESVASPGLTRSSKNPKVVDSLDSEGVELKQRKRKEKAQDDNLNSVEADGEAQTPLVAKKSKKEKTQNLNSGSESNSIVSNAKSMINEEEPKDLSPEKKKKKRKRDELERQYEMKKYGAVEVEEEGLGEKVLGKKRKKADDDGAGTMVPKEGFDDESKLLRTVFVGNVPLKIKKKVLIKEFSRFGEIESVRIRSVPLNDVSKLIFTFLVS